MSLRDLRTSNSLTSPGNFPDALRLYMPSSLLLFDGDRQLHLERGEPPLVVRQGEAPDAVGLGRELALRLVVHLGAPWTPRPGFGWCGSKMVSTSVLNGKITV